MGLAWRIAVLGLGCIGSGLAAITALAGIINWPAILDVDWRVELLLGIMVVTGGAQWFVFAQRPFRSAITLFFVTIVAWSGAFFWHFETIKLNCSKTRPCVVYIYQTARP